MTLISKISGGIALAVLGDGTLVHLERSGVRLWTVVHSTPNGTLLVRLLQRHRLTDVTADPSRRSAAILVSPGHGLEAFAEGKISPLARLVGASSATQGAGGRVVTVTRGRQARLSSVDSAGTTTGHGPARSTTADMIPHPECDATLALAGTERYRRLVLIRAGAHPRSLAALPGATRLATLNRGDARIAIGYADGRIELRDPAAPSESEVVTTLPAAVWGLAFDGVNLVAGFGSDIDLVPV